jgi:hypothetical protein
MNSTAREGQLTSDRPLEVGEDGTSNSDSLDNGTEVVVEEQHGGGFLTDVGSGDVHGDSKVGTLESRCIVDTVSSDSDLDPHRQSLESRGGEMGTYDVTETLSVLDDLELVLGTGTGEDDLGVGEDTVPLPSFESVNLVSVDDDGVVLVLVDVLDGSVEERSSVRHRGGREGRVPSSAGSDVGLGLGSDQVDLARDGLGSLGVITSDLGTCAESVLLKNGLWRRRLTMKTLIPAKRRVPTASRTPTRRVSGDLAPDLGMGTHRAWEGPRERRVRRRCSHQTECWSW